MLLFGASGPIGSVLLPRLLAAGHAVHAVSRAADAAARDARPHARLHEVHWHAGCLPAPIHDLPDAVDLLISAGPLDLFAYWHARHAPRATRLIAFGSTSVHVKQASSDAGERALAQRLLDAETGLLASARAQGAAATLLRPTLIYGSGREASLARIVALAQRLGGVPLPADARGLRQPVHADDLAAAALAAWPCTVTHGAAYDLPGGETLAYHAMVARLLATLDPPRRAWRMPNTAFDAALALAHRLGRARAFTPAMRARLRADLVFDASAARRDFGYAPRTFRPAAAMFAAG